MTCLWVSEGRVSTVFPLCPKFHFFFSMLCLKLFIISFCCLCYTVYREQGWRSGESTRLPPMWPGFKSRRRCHMWVEVVFGSLLCSERFFSGYSGFPLPSKTNISKFQFDQESGRRRTTMWICYLQIVIYLFILFILYRETQKGRSSS